MKSFFVLLVIFQILFIQGMAIASPYAYERFTSFSKFERRAIARLMKKKNIELADLRSKEYLGTTWRHVYLLGKASKFYFQMVDKGIDGIVFTRMKSENCDYSAGLYTINYNKPVNSYGSFPGLQAVIEPKSAVIESIPCDQFEKFLDLLQEKL